MGAPESSRRPDRMPVNSALNPQRPDGVEDGGCQDELWTDGREVLSELPNRQPTLCFYEAILSHTSMGQNGHRLFRVRPVAVQTLAKMIPLSLQGIQRR